MQLLKSVCAVSAAIVMAVGAPNTANATSPTNAVDDVLDSIVTEADNDLGTPDGISVSGTGNGPATARQAAVAQAGECRLFTWAPGVGGAVGDQTVGVQGGRFDCPNAVSFRVELWYQPIYQPNDGPVLMNWADGYGNEAIRAYARCYMPGTWWGVTRSSTGNYHNGPAVQLCH